MTKQIEQALLWWHPAKIGNVSVNNMRGEHTALEGVSECGTTKSGIIDAVRVSEYFGNFQTRGICRIKSLGLG